jgi:hypothetical protein
LVGHAGQVAADGPADDLNQQADEHFHGKTPASRKGRDHSRAATSEKTMAVVEVSFIR